MRRPVVSVTSRAISCAAAIILGVTALTACGKDKVHIAFTPKTGAQYRYRVHVRAVTVSNFVGRGDEPRRNVDDFVIETDEFVSSVDDTGSDVEVELHIPGVGTRRLTARFDRGAQLVAVTRIEGVPSEALGQLGISEILPGASGAPPARGLAPGDRWTIDAPATPLGGDGSRLRGTGRLVSLGVVQRKNVATLESHFELPVQRLAEASDANLRLDGTQTSDVTTVRNLRDGAVQSAKAVTHATYNVTVIPPVGGAGAPVSGTLSVELRSETARVG